MSTERVRQLVRHFSENGLKVLLGDPANVRELLGLTGSDFVEGMDFTAMKREETSYVAEDFRHLESDVVWSIPFRGKKADKRIIVYVLIEHQSEPDPLMVFRVMLYMLLIWRDQTREIKRAQGHLRGVRLQPILPVVFYTGTRTWTQLEPLSALMEGGDLFARLTPRLDPLFVNLPALAPELLSRQGGYFGVVMQLVQSRRENPEAFRDVLRHVVEQLEAMPQQEQTRWHELLSYIHALVYHEREESEHQPLHQTIEDAVRNKYRREEVNTMPRTIAEALKDEGRKEGYQAGGIEMLQNTLLRQLRQRFDKVPISVEKVIRATQQVERLNGWLDLVLSAQTLKDIGITAKP